MDESPEKMYEKAMRIPDDVLEEFINQAEERYNTVAKGGIPENIEIFEIKESMLENGLLLTELLNLSNIVSSKSEGRRMIEQNGISVNETKENDVNKLITTTDFNNDELIIQKGKKQFKKIVLIK